jgi:hypothetical protein
LEQLGRCRDALRHARRAAELDPASREAAALAARLEGVGGGGGGDCAPEEAATTPAAAAGGAGPLSAAAALGLVPASMRGGSEFVPPPAGGADANVLVLLHGLGDRPGPFAGEAYLARFRAGLMYAPAASARAICIAKGLRRPGHAIPSALAGVGARASGSTGCSVQGAPHAHAPPPPHTQNAAALARHMALPHTASLALAGPIEVPLTGGGRAWVRSFDDSFELIAPAPGERRRARSLAETAALLLPLLAALAGEAPGASPGGGAAGGGGGESGGDGAARPPRRRVHLLGYSQGGCVALEVARLLCPRGGGGGGGPPPWLGSVVSVAGPLLEEGLGEMEEEQRRRQAGGHDAAGREGDAAGAAAAGGRAVPVLVTWGDRDEAVPRSAVDRRGRGVGRPRERGAGSARADAPWANPPGRARGARSGRAERRARAARLRAQTGRRPTPARLLPPSRRARRSAALLRALGCEAEVYVAGGKGHAMLGGHQGEARRVMALLARALAAPPPAGGFVEVERGALGRGGGDNGRPP